MVLYPCMWEALKRPGGLKSRAHGAERGRPRGLGMGREWREGMGSDQNTLYKKKNSKGKWSCPDVLSLYHTPSPFRLSARTQKQALIRHGYLIVHLATWRKRVTIQLLFSKHHSVSGIPSQHQKTEKEINILFQLYAHWVLYSKQESFNLMWNL